MILVLGSINMDLTTLADEIPKIGETVIGNTFNQYPGGKGANQAVCAARLNAEVVFWGKVGNDFYGNTMLTEMQKSGVDVSCIERGALPTGIAVISVDSKGQNSIIVIPGANSEVDIEYVKRHIKCIENCNIILAQHETPIEITKYAFEVAKKYGKITILNPAPAMDLSSEMTSLTDILVPNEHELARLSGIASDTKEGIMSGAQALMNKGIKSIIVTMGEKGVWFFDEEINHIFPTNSVNVVDTTAAGDSFLGGFVTSYVKDKNMTKAIAYGQLVASYTIQMNGAQSSMPSYEALEAYQKMRYVL